MPFTVFEGAKLAAAGDLHVARSAALAALARGGARVLVIDDDTGSQVDLDLRPPAALPAPKSTRGRPKLGVVAREVTLLPRHWDWLSSQPGGASAALRRLVEEARRTHEAGDRARRAQTAVYQAMSVLAGDLPGYEEALRALYAGDDLRFDSLIAEWPHDVRGYIASLASAERAARPA